MRHFLVIALVAVTLAAGALFLKGGDEASAHDEGGPCYFVSVGWVAYSIPTYGFSWWGPYFNGWKTAYVYTSQEHWHYSSFYNGQWYSSPCGFFP